MVTFKFKVKLFYWHTISLRWTVYILGIVANSFTDSYWLLFWRYWCRLYVLSQAASSVERTASANVVIRDSSPSILLRLHSHQIRCIVIHFSTDANTRVLKNEWLWMGPVHTAVIYSVPLQCNKKVEHALLFFGVTEWNKNGCNCNWTEVKTKMSYMFVHSGHVKVKQRLANKERKKSGRKSTEADTARKQTLRWIAISFWFWCEQLVSNDHLKVSH